MPGSDSPAGRAVVVGYATVDYVLHLDESFGGTGTAAARRMPDGRWPRAGGAALFASRQLSLNGVAASPVTWVGSDDGARRYRRACELATLETAGICRIADAETPTCILLYQPDGSYGCLFSDMQQSIEALTVAQENLIAAADLVVISASPPQFVERVIARAGESARVAWIAKEDDTVFPDGVRRLCAARADFIFCNAGERAFVDASCAGVSRSARVVIETRGADGVLIDNGHRSQHASVTAIETDDTTGAGDTFAGATLAHILRGERDIEAAVRLGIEAASEFLGARRRNA